MASLVPQEFPTPSEAAIASFSFTDIAEGTGIVVFQGANSKEVTTSSYYLAQNILYSNNGFTAGNTAGTSFVKVLDLDFDIVFNMPQRIKGNVRANITFGAGLTNTAESGADVKAIMKVVHYDGTTETIIGTANSPAATGSNMGGQVGEIDYETFNIKAVVATSQHFKKGETLRIILELYGKRTGANEGTVRFLHDPKDRIDTTTIPTGTSGGVRPLTSQFQVNVPFILDL